MFDKQKARRDLRRLDKAREAVRQAEAAVRQQKTAFMSARGVYGATEEMLRMAVL